MADPLKNETPENTVGPNFTGCQIHSLPSHCRGRVIVEPHGTLFKLQGFSRELISNLMRSGGENNEQTQDP